MPHDGYKKTELGEIPKEWDVAKLSDERLIQKMKAGGTPLSSLENYYKNGSIPFVKIEDMTRSGKYLFKTEFKITNEGLKNCSAWLVPKDSIIYSMYASFGEAAINKIPVATNQAIIAIIPWSAADVEYLYYALWNLKPSLHKYLRETTQKNLNFKQLKFISPNEHMELIKRCRPEKDDILYSKNGTIGIRKIIDWDWEFSIFVSLCLIKTKPDKIRTDYLFYILGSDIIKKQIRIRTKQMTVMNLHLEEIKEFQITKPSPREQCLITEILTAADERIEKEEAYREKLLQIKKGLMQDLLTGRVRVNKYNGGKYNV